MNVRGFFGAVLVTTLCRAQGEEPASPPLPGTAAKTNAALATNAVAVNLSLTNRALLAMSKLRGVQPEKIRLQTRGHGNGPFEIDIASVSEAEASQLSKELGSEAVVVLDHVSANGATRTNWSFRGGVGRKVIAPAAPTGLGPDAKRLYVWPQSSARPAAPSGIRVRNKVDE